MTPTKTISIGPILSADIHLHQFDHVDGEFYYQIEINMHNAEGSHISMNLPLEGKFNPGILGQKLIRMETE